MENNHSRIRKPIDPALRSYLDAIVLPALPPSASDSERAEVRRSLMLRALLSRDVIPGLPNKVSERDFVILEGLSARMYKPADAQALLPVLVYAHGGGWVAGSVETHDPFCRLLSEAAGLIVLSVDYRLAPEHPFPAGLEDVLAAYRWAAAHATTYGGDSNRLLLGGDSSGANLAAVAANLLCAGNEAIRPVGSLLLYPVLDHPSAQHASYRENGTGYGLESSLMEWFWHQYVGNARTDDPMISPLRLSQFPALPPTLVATAEYDPLRDEGIAYAEKLAKAGIAVTHVHAPDMHHNFPVHPATVGRFPQSIAAVQQFATWLREIA
jgi:acetyl esterase